MRNYLLLLLSIVSAATANAQVIFTENMGTPGGTTTIAANVFQNSGTYTYSGTGDVRNTTASTGYTGASGGGNVFITNTAGTNFQMSGINTSSYTSLALTLGHYKSSTTGNNELVIEVSSDGTTYTSLSYSRPTGTGTASWLLISPSGTIPSTSNLRIRFRQTSTSTQFRIDDIKLTGVLAVPCTPGSAPTTSASGVMTSPACTTSGISFTPGNGNDRLILMGTAPVSTNPTNGTSYTASATYGSGGAIGAAFAVYNGTGNAITVNGLTAGTTYYYSIYEYNLTSTNCDESYKTTGFTSGSFTTLTGCAPTTPQIHDILADACGSAEGTDELVMFTNGTSPLSISTVSIAFPAGGTYCNSGCSANTLVNNTSFVSSLNTTAGCTVFAYADPIPASAEVVVFCGNPPSTVLDYSYLCSSGQTYYVIFCNNTNTSGRFANSGTGTRTLSIDFNGTPEAVTYAPNSLLGDGSFVNFDNSGNATYYSNPACVFPLGVELTSLSSEIKERSTELYWSTASESNAHYFSVQRAGETGFFEDIGKVNCYGNSQVTQHYHFSDDAPLNGVSYYRLRQFDNDGKSTYSQTISVQRNGNPDVVFYNNALHMLTFPEDLLEGTSVEIINTAGSMSRKIPVNLRINTASVDNLVTGIYFIRYTDVNGNTKTAKVLID